MERKNRKELQAAYKERKVVGGIYMIKNLRNGKMLLACTADLKGSLNRFEFSQKTGGCVYLKVQEDWRKFGADAFSFEVVEELEKGDAQSMNEFKEDLEVLLEIWLDKFGDRQLY